MIGVVLVLLFFHPPFSSVRTRSIWTYTLLSKHVVVKKVHGNVLFLVSMSSIEYKHSGRPPFSSGSCARNVIHQRRPPHKVVVNKVVHKNRFEPNGDVEICRHLHFTGWGCLDVDQELHILGDLLYRYWPRKILTEHGSVTISQHTIHTLSYLSRQTY